MEFYWAIAGGALIGLAVSVMLLFNGRVTGISGILYGLLAAYRGDLSWRVFFIFGLLSGGIVLRIQTPDVFGTPLASNWTIATAGLLVGFGTVLGNGCTSGHGVCGVSRLSLRSIIATLVFIGFGALTVLSLKTFGMLK